MIGREDKTQKRGTNDRKKEKEKNTLEDKKNECNDKKRFKYKWGK